MELNNSEPHLHPPDLKSLSFSVSFPGWRLANKNFKSWLNKMSSLHKPTWEKAGIYKAVMSSTYRIKTNTNLVLGVTERWCNETKSFVFPWGEISITLEDVMVLLGFSVLGLPVLAGLDSLGKKVKWKLEREWCKIKEEKGCFVSQIAWMRSFEGRVDDDEVEHVAFLVAWLSYFVFPLSTYHIDKAVFSVAIHLSRGVKVALGPAVLSQLYAELGLLKSHILAFGELRVTDKIEVTALFKLVQVWTWERFKELRPRPNQLVKGEPRLALWNEKCREVNDVRGILDNSKVEKFEWRPYTKPMKNWEFPRFYPEKKLLVPVGHNLDDEFVSFARCVKVSELVGFDHVEHYFPDRVASQFGMLQDVPCVVNRKNLSHEKAWDHYDKRISDLTLHIPSRYDIPCATPMFCDWWKKTYQELRRSLEKRGVAAAAETLKAGGSRFVTAGDKKKKTRKRRKYPTLSCYKTHKYMKQAPESNERDMDRCKAQVSSDNDEEYGSFTKAQAMRRSQRRYCDVMSSEGGDCEPLGKKVRLEADNQKSGPSENLDSISTVGVEPVPPPQDNSSDPLLGANGVDIVVSPLRTEQTCDDELASNTNMFYDSREEPDILLQDGSIAGQKANSGEKLCSEAEKVDDVVGKDRLVQEKLASGGSNGDKINKADKSMVLSTPDESNIRIAAEDGTLGHDCLSLDDIIGSEVKSSERTETLEKRNEVNDSNEKHSQELEVLVSSIESLISNAERNVAWLQEREARNQKKIAAAR